MNLLGTIPNLLLACLRQTPPDDLTAQLAQLTREQWAQLLALAVEQHVPSLLYHRLKRLGDETIIPTAIGQVLQKKYYGTALHNMRLYQELGKLIDALHAEGITALVLKGAHLAAIVYETMALRTMADVDIMVQQADLPATIQQIQALGYQPITPLFSLDTYLTRYHHLPRFVHPDTVASIEVHWTITSSTRTYAISMEELWARSQPLTLTTITTRGLCPEHLLLHVCMHATYQHQLRQGVRFLCDIAAIVQHYGDALDWEVVIQQAIAWKWQHGIFLAFYATQEMLGTQLPAHVLPSLNPLNHTLPNQHEFQAILFPTDRALTNASSRDFLNLLSTPQLSQKLTLLWHRFFLSREEMATTYSVAAHSPRLYLYYPVRVKDLLGRYMHKTWRMWRGDPTITTLTRNQAQLQQWLEQE